MSFLKFSVGARCFVFLSELRRLFKGTLYDVLLLKQERCQTWSTALKFKLATPSSSSHKVAGVISFWSANGRGHTNGLFVCLEARKPCALLVRGIAGL